MVKRIPNEDGSGFTDTQRVLVLYQNASARKQAINSTPQLAELCSTGSEAGVHWFSFAALGDAKTATLATDKCLAVNLVIFAMTPAGDLSPETKTWIESWVCRRGEAEGTIVGLITYTLGACEIASLKEIYLRNVAHRAGMDYLSNMPSVSPQPMPDSPDSYARRAGHITSVLDDILNTNWPPPTLPH